MAEVKRFQSKCYYSSPEHSGSLWGKFFYLYQGKGSLRLTDDALEFDSRALRRSIPLKSIKNIGMGLFSKWAKPFGLAYIHLSYVQDERAETIYLVPARSAWAATWSTSKLVASWIETLAKVDGLSSRIDRPLPEVPGRPSLARFALVLLMMSVPTLISCALLMCGWWIAHRP